MDAPECYVGGKLVKASVRRMNFGQSWRTPEIVEADYRVELPRRILDEYLARELPEFILDSKEFPTSDPFEEALRAADWNVEPVLDLALRYFAFEVLLAAFGDGGGDFILNSVERAGLLKDRCWLEGRGRHAQEGVAYQDL
jgi:hypothetical protein